MSIGALREQLVLLAKATSPDTQLGRHRVQR
jgi:hypothetical protein